jgi:hypothetical protein
MTHSSYSPFFVLYAIHEIIVFFIRALFAGKNPRLLLKEEEQEFDNMLQLQNDPHFIYTEAYHHQI